MGANVPDLHDHSAELQARVNEARRDKTPLNIVGGGTKDFYGRRPAGRPLAVAGHRGVVAYEPTELVITARGGTPLEELEALLDEHRQMLPFEPPHFGPGATLGGCVACGLSGPRRPYAGAVRDYVLGIKCLTGRGEILSFGGRVMKNVAGYDLSRLMTGAMGTLGVLLEVSLKILPKPAAETTLVSAATPGDALRLMNEWAGKPLPLSAASYHEGRLYVRLSGTESAVREAAGGIGGEVLSEAERWWFGLREHTHPFFEDRRPLWRLATPPAAPLPAVIDRDWLIEWGGGQRWLKSDAPAEQLRAAAAAAGGHATAFRHGDRDARVFHPLPPAMALLQRRIKRAFDPDGIFNIGRLDDQDSDFR